jgi:hypothetical protein
MSFTEDELQSFNTILEQRLQAHQRAMERAWDQRMIEFRRELDQRLGTVHAEVLRSVSQKLSDIQVKFETTLSEKFNLQPSQLMKAFQHEIEQRQQQTEGNIDRMLAAQLLGIEQLVSHYSQGQDLRETFHIEHVPAQFDAIEVQTELTWEELMDIISRALDDRLSAMKTAIQKSLKNLENNFSVRLQSLREDIFYDKSDGKHSLHQGDTTGLGEILRGVEQLEQVMESMQVVMTSNHALLSNRLYHHQQLPFERAHVTQDQSKQLSDGVDKPFTIAEEHVLNGLESENVTGQIENDE